MRERGKPNRNVRMTWWNRTICSLLSSTCTASHVTYKKAITLSHSLYNYLLYFAHLRQQCQNSKSVIFQERILKVLKCYNFLRVQRHTCPPAVHFANCVMTLYLLKVHLQCFYTNNSKMPNFELWHSCRKWVICVLISCFSEGTVRISVNCNAYFLAFPVYYAV